MLLNRQRLLELNSLLGQLLCLKDSDFSKFLNSDTSTIIKPFINCLQAFWSSSSLKEYEDQDQDLNLYELIFKFLLRLCPSFNSKLKTNNSSNMKQSNNSNSSAYVLKAVICPKKFISCLFDVDPLGLLVFLYTNWNKNDKNLEIIREELIPQTLIQKISKLSTEQQSQTQANENDFLKWIIKTSTIKSGDALKNNERDSILKRFEYESDDDYFEGEESDGNDLNNNSKSSNTMDPIQVKLFTFYTSNPSTFSRTKSSRESTDRKILLRETQLAHEQIEGWALMLERNPKKGRIIQDFIIWSKINK